MITMFDASRPWTDKVGSFPHMWLHHLTSNSGYVDSAILRPPIEPDVKAARDHDYAMLFDASHAWTEKAGSFPPTCGPITLWPLIEPDVEAARDHDHDSRARIDAIPHLNGGVAVVLSCTSNGYLHTPHPI